MTRPTCYRAYTNLANLDIKTISHQHLAFLAFGADEQREIVFKDFTTDAVTHTTMLDTTGVGDYRSVIGYFAHTLMMELRLVNGHNMLYGKLKVFVQTELFDQTVDLEDPNTLRNLAELAATKTVLEGFKRAVNALTVQDRGDAEIHEVLSVQRTRPFVVKEQGYLVPKKSVFSRIIGDSHFELEFAAFLEYCSDVVAFAKNYLAVNFKLDYVNSDGDIANYYPDFLVKLPGQRIVIVETKGLQDLDVPRKMPHPFPSHFACILIHLCVQIGATGEEGAELRAERADRVALGVQIGSIQRDNRGAPASRIAQHGIQLAQLLGIRVILVVAQPVTPDLLGGGAHQQVIHVMADCERRVDLRRRGQPAQQPGDARHQRRFRSMDVAKDVGVRDVERRAAGWVHPVDAIGHVEMDGVSPKQRTGNQVFGAALGRSVAPQFPACMQTGNVIVRRVRRRIARHDGNDEHAVAAARRLRDLPAARERRVVQVRRKVERIKVCHFSPPLLSALHPL